MVEVEFFTREERSKVFRKKNRIGEFAPNRESKDE